LLLCDWAEKKVFWHQSEARATPTAWNWSVKTLSPGALSLVLDVSSPEFFSCPFRVFPAPTNCPWVSEDGQISKRSEARFDKNFEKKKNQYQTRFESELKFERKKPQN